MTITTDRVVSERPVEERVVERPKEPERPRTPGTRFAWLWLAAAIVLVGVAATLVVIAVTGDPEPATLVELSVGDNPEVFGLGAQVLPDLWVEIAAPTAATTSYGTPELLGVGAQALPDLWVEAALSPTLLESLDPHESPELFGPAAHSMTELWTRGRQA